MELLADVEPQREARRALSSRPPSPGPPGGARYFCPFLCFFPEGGGSPPRGSGHGEGRAAAGAPARLCAALRGSARAVGGSARSPAEPERFSAEFCRASERLGGSG